MNIWIMEHYDGKEWVAEAGAERNTKKKGVISRGAIS